MSAFVALTLAEGAVWSTLTVYAACPTLPARSVHAALRVRIPSPDDTLTVVQLALSTPDPAPSVQCQVTVTSPLFQPALLVAGAWVGCAVGPVRSMWRLATVALAVFPARSATVAPTDRSLPSPITTLLAGHVPSMPESVSAHVQTTVTSPLYQP